MSGNRRRHHFEGQIQFMRRKRGSLPMESKSTLRLAMMLAVVFVALFGSPARADVIMDWNAKADAIATQKQLQAGTHGRGLAILHVEMFEAVNALERRYALFSGVPKYPVANANGSSARTTS